MQYPQILFWKWDDSHLTEERIYRKQIDDICARSCYSHIYIGTAWCSRGLSDSLVLERVKDAVDYIHRKGRKAVVEIDIRAERGIYTSKYPNGITALIRMIEIPLDENGIGRDTLPISDCGDQFGRYYPIGADLLGAYSVDELCDFTYQGSAQKITEAVSVEYATDKVELSVSASSSNAGKTAIVLVNVWYELPDSASDDCIAAFDDLFNKCRELPLDGVALDEWGYLAHPGFDFTQAWKSPWYSKALADSFEKKFDVVAEDFYFGMVYASPETTTARIGYINFYYEHIRNVTVDVEKWYYNRAKEQYGSDAFVGVHPTWYAISELDNHPELYKNGLNWWAVPRDFGFTDEIAPYSVRSALAHKWKANTWYNMWYGEGTGWSWTFPREVWQNARFGGRIITLGYEVLKERGVAQLKYGDRLERVSQMEEKLQLLNKLQKAPLDCRVAVVIGMPAAANHLDNVLWNRKWTRYSSTFAESFQVARDLWNAGQNCDLIPSYEIEDGSLKLDSDGRLVYGNQSYDCMIFCYMDYSKIQIKSFIEQVAISPTKLIVIGTGNRDFDGNACDYSDIISSADLSYDVRPEGLDLMHYLVAWGIPTGRVPHGAVLQDGTVILTCGGARDSSTGNRVKVSFEHKGCKIDAEFEDILILAPNEGGFEPHGEYQSFSCTHS